MTHASSIRIRFGHWGPVVMAIALALFGMHCGRANRAEPMGVRSPQLEKALREAETDEQRWEAVLDACSAMLEHRSDVPRNVVIKEGLFIPGPVADVILTEYPTITKRLDWSAEDLRQLGDQLESNETTFWDEETTGGCETTRAYYRSSLTYGQVASILLRELTGIEFTDKAQFDQWFAKNEEKLRWDDEARMFVIDEDVGE